MAGIGHNNGPSLALGLGYKRYLWSKARADLLPVLPLPVVRMRVKRAAEIGLDYKTYATVRATTGRDVVALLFSTNALRLFRADQALAEDRAAKLRAIQNCARRALAVPPLSPSGLSHLALEGAWPAPRAFAPWPEMATAIAAAKAPYPADGTLLIGDTSADREWSLAGRLAGYLPSARFFPDATS
ncbi:MAG: hypothetical protein AAGP08_02380 [Pseudomonadota bacterium]